MKVKLSLKWPKIVSFATLVINFMAMMDIKVQHVAFPTTCRLEALLQQNKYFIARKVHSRRASNNANEVLELATPFLSVSFYGLF